jgi:hypothetical protein
MGKPNHLTDRGHILCLDYVFMVRPLLGITELDKEKNQCIRGKTGAQNIVQEIQQYQKSGYNT